MTNSINPTRDKGPEYHMVNFEKLKIFLTTDFTSLRGNTSKKFRRLTRNLRRIYITKYKNESLKMANIKSIIEFICSTF